MEVSKNVEDSNFDRAYIPCTVFSDVARWDNNCDRSRRRDIKILGGISKEGERSKNKIRPKRGFNMPQMMNI